MEIRNQRISLNVIFYAQITLYLKLFESNLFLYGFPLEENKVSNVTIVTYLSDLLVR